MRHFVQSRCSESLPAAGEDAEEVLQAMFADCAAGTAALVMNQLSAVEKKQGQAAARRKFHEVAGRNSYGS